MGEQGVQGAGIGVEGSESVWQGTPMCVCICIVSPQRGSGERHGALCGRGRCHPLASVNPAKQRVNREEGLLKA